MCSGCVAAAVESHIDARIGPARTYIKKGKYEEAIAVARKPELDDPYLLATIGEAHARLGKRAEAQKIIERLKKQAKQRYVPPYAVSWIHIGLGEKQQALEWFEKSYENREDTLLWLNYDVHSDRSGPRAARWIVP